MSKRKGKCLKCGLCCHGCYLLNSDNNCLAYNDRPRWCHKDFPVDEFDQKAKGTYGKCGYYW